MTNEMRIGVLVAWKCEGLVYSGKVVSFDDSIVAVCFIEEVREGGNVRWPNPILFIGRDDITWIGPLPGIFQREAAANAV